jgi:PAS domain S-box-containing protein
MSSHEIDLKQAKVLMVDDTPANIDVLRKVLAKEGYQLFFANSGEKALKIANRALPDLILLDVMMPGMDGYETCRRLKEIEETQHIPIIFITAKNQVEDVIEAFQLGAVDYINKPFRQEEVCMRVSAHLQTQILFKQREHLIKDLRNSEERFRLLAHASPVGICQADREGKVVYTNQKWQTIFSLGENVGNSWLQAIHLNDRQKVEKLWKESVLNNDECSTKFRINVENEVRWVHAHVIPLNYEGTQLEGFVGTVEDITEFKRAEEQILHAKDTAEKARIAAEAAQTISEQARIAAEAANHAKSTFLAKMNHELRTPLNAIIGYSDMLEEEAEDLGYEDILPDLYKIQTAGKNLLSIVSDILDLSKIEAEKIELNPTEFPVIQLIENVVTTIKPLVSNQNNTLVVEQVGELGIMYTDYQKIVQILLNLLNNASKFTKQGTITFCIIRQRMDWLGFQVKDTGEGIAADKIASIFNAFTQTDNSYTRAYDGSGLGLTICEHLSRAIGGHIYVSSEIGIGSTFTLQMPIQLPKTAKH